MEDGKEETPECSICTDTVVQMPPLLYLSKVSWLSWRCSFLSFWPQEVRKDSFHGGIYTSSQLCKIRSPALCCSNHEHAIKRNSRHFARPCSDSKGHDFLSYTDHNIVERSSTINLPASRWSSRRDAGVPLTMALLMHASVERDRYGFVIGVSRFAQRTHLSKNPSTKAALVTSPSRGTGTDRFH